MHVNFLINDVAFMDYKTQEVTWGWEPTDQRLGGTEESVVRWGEELVKRGHEVVVFKNGKKEGYVHNGVWYAHKDTYLGGGDICINVKASTINPKEPTLYLTNETDANLKDLSKYLGVIWPSQWAVDNIPVNNHTFILPHGYDHTKIYPKEKVSKQCLFASSPDRGIEILEQIWPIVLDSHPDAHLYVTYGARMNTENTTYGQFTEEEMNELYNTSDLLVYPCTGGELFGISPVKAQAAGAIPVYFPTMALAETVKGGIACTDSRDMLLKLNSLLDDVDQKNKLRQELANIHFDNWEDTTTKLLEIIEQVLN